MKFNKPILLILSLLCFLNLSGQELPNLNFSFNDKSDYVKYEGQVLQIAKFFLSKPVSYYSPQKQEAFALMLKWMEGTPDYQFSIDKTATDFSKYNEDIVIPIFSSMINYVLHNKEKSKDPNEVKRNSYLAFLNYCEQPANEVRQTKEIKKAIEAKNKGSLDKYLNI